MITVISTKRYLKVSISFMFNYFVIGSMVVLALKLLLYSTIKIITKIKLVIVDLNAIEVVIIATVITIRFS